MNERFDPQSVAPLSPAGEVRRAAILHLAEQALEGRVRSRKARRALIAAIVLAACAVAVAALVPRPAPERAAPIVVKGDAPAPPRDFPLEILSDEGLVRELKANGIAAGLLRVDGAVRLVRPDGSEFALPGALTPSS